MATKSTPQLVIQAVAAAAPPAIPTDYGPRDRSRDVWARLLEVLRATIARIGLKEVAYALDVSPSQLADALAERERKGVRAEWLPAILALATEHERVALVGALAAPCGLEVTVVIPLTPEQQLDRLRDEVRHRFGKAGEQLLLEMRR